MNNRRPAEVFPPGEFIRDELEARGWTQEDLAQITGRPQATINLIINDKRGITPDTAVELAGAFDTSAEFWLNLDTAYRLSKVTRPIEVAEIRKRATLFELSPVKEMQRRGWIDSASNIVDLERELETFYKHVKVEEFRVAARASTEQGQITPEQMAWCVRALNLATSIPTPAYQQNKMEECKRGLRLLAASAKGAAQVPELLASYGIRFVVVEHLSGSKIDGAALWLGDRFDKPVIAVSLRYDRIDSFWHTVCHEVSHIQHKDYGAIVDVDLFGTENQQQDQDFIAIEQRANREAANTLIDSDKLESFILRKRPFFSKVAIIQFANANRIHPGIVAGQLHHRFKNWSANREMLEKVRNTVLTRSVTDGWGVQITK